MDSEDRVKAKIPLPALWAGVFVVVFGLTKAIFAFQMLLVTTVLGVAVGPLSLLALNAFDFTIGTLATVAAWFFVARRAWAGKLMKIGWVPLVFYEVGRTLGLASAGISSIADGKGLIVSLALLVLLISAGVCASSPASEAYIRSGT